MSEWLEGEAQDAREKQRVAAVEFAKLYEVFVDDPRAAALLQHWTDSVEQRDTAPSASIQEYAHAEGTRMFIRGIKRQVKLAQTEGKP